MYATVLSRPLDWRLIDKLADLEESDQKYRPHAKDCRAPVPPSDGATFAQVSHNSDAKSPLK